MEIKTCYAFPVMGNIPWSAFGILEPPLQFFNCGPPAHTNNFILLTPWWRKRKDGGGHLDCKKGLDMVSLSCFFPILSYSKASLSQHIFTGPHIFSFHSRIGHQERGKHKPFWVTFNMFLCSAHSNFSSLHREFFQIPFLAVWFLSNIFLTNSSLTKFTSVFLLPGALNLVALGFYTAEHYISTHHLHIRLRSWLSWCICHASVPVQSTSWHVREMCLWRVRAYGR